MTRQLRRWGFALLVPIALAWPLVEGGTRVLAWHAQRQLAHVAAAPIPSSTAPLVREHDVAARHALAERRMRDAARHATLALRLAPDNAARGALAERLLDVALLEHARRPALWASLLAGALLVGFAFRNAMRSLRRRRIARDLDGLSIEAQWLANGRSLPGDAKLPADTESLALDLWVRGPRRRTIWLAPALSHAATSETIRLPHASLERGDALRVPLSARTLGRLADKPGTWRLHVVAAGRLLGGSSLVVGAPSLRPA